MPRSIGKQIAHFFELIDWLLKKVEWLVLGLAAGVMIFVMCIVSVDALGRYLFNKPVFFTLDLVSHFLLPIIMLITAGSVLRQAKHISVDMFASLLPVRLSQALLGLGLLLVVPVFWIMTYRVALTSIESFEQGKVAFGLIPWPFWVEQAIYAVCMGLLAVRLLHIGAINLLAAILGEPEIGISMQHTHESPLEETL